MQAEELKADFVFAIKERIKNIGGQMKLAETSGLRQATISDYSLGKSEIEGVSVGTLLRLFPDLKISFLGTEDSRETYNESRSMESELLSLFRRLPANEQARCLLVIGAHFSDVIKK